MAPSRFAQQVLGWLGRAARRVHAFRCEKFERAPRLVTLGVLSCAPAVVISKQRGSRARLDLFSSSRDKQDPHRHFSPPGSDRGFDDDDDLTLDDLEMDSMDDSVSPVEPEPEPEKTENIHFNTAGRFLLGLGTLGVFGYHNASGLFQDGFGRLDLKKVAGDSQSEPFKRKFFQNLNEMFGLAAEVRDEAAAAAATRPASKPAPAKHDGPSFQRLVQGDRLVLREGDITRDQWKALSEFLGSCPHIKSLRLQGVEISAKEADELGKGLQQIRNITFCDNSIGLNDGTLEVVVALLLCCGMLESTSIIRNSIRDSHVPQILTLLNRHNSLTRISLSWNGIGDRGATMIARALRKLRNSVRDIDLSYNAIGKSGQQMLSNVHKARTEYFGPMAPKLHINFAHNEPAREFRPRVADWTSHRSRGSYAIAAGGGGSGSGQHSPGGSSSGGGSPGPDPGVLPRAMHNYAAPWRDNGFPPFAALTRYQHHLFPRC